MIKFTAPKDIMNIHSETLKQFGDTQLWWRGHTSSSFELKPGVYRKSVYGDNEPGIYEKSVALHFKRRAPGLYSDCPTSNSDWLFLMQHYGLPTRLLDWTGSLLIGLFFAVVKSKTDPKCKLEVPGTLWALHPGRLNEIQKPSPDIIVQIEKHKIANDLVEQAFKGHQHNHLKPILAIAPSHRDDRMVAQQAYSTLHGTPEALEQLPGADGFLLKIEIEPDAKEPTRDFLTYLGIKECTLFPDLEHLAKDLKYADY